MARRAAGNMPSAASPSAVPACSTDRLGCDQPRAGLGSRRRTGTASSGLVPRNGGMETTVVMTDLLPGHRAQQPAQRLRRADRLGPDDAPVVTDDDGERCDDRVVALE